MANLAVFASGNGSNFQAIAESINKSSHKLDCLICDSDKAYAIERAHALNIDVIKISYTEQTRQEVESRLVDTLQKRNISLIVLAGFMKILTPVIINAFKNKIINIHPALLPNYPGTHAIERSYKSGDKELGISIHYVDFGVDTGPVILQKSFVRNECDSLEDVEKKIHMLEHLYYPEVILKILDSVGK